MKTKLTLSVDKNSLDLARKEAFKSGKSISRMFEDFIKINSKTTERTIHTKDLVGALKGLNIDDSKTAIRNSYSRKYIH